MVFQEDAEKPFHATEKSPMDHEGTGLGSVLADIGDVETFRHIEIKLNRAQLPGPADRVFHHKIDLRAVECPISRIYLIRNSRAFQRVFQSSLSRIPICFASDTFLRPRAEEELEGFKT